MVFSQPRGVRHTMLWGRTKIEDCLQNVHRHENTMLHCSNDPFVCFKNVIGCTWSSWIIGVMVMQVSSANIVFWTQCLIWLYKRRGKLKAPEQSMSWSIIWEKYTTQGVVAKEVWLALFPDKIFVFYFFKAKSFMEDRGDEGVKEIGNRILLLLHLLLF